METGADKHVRPQRLAIDLKKQSIRERVSISMGNRAEDTGLEAKVISG